MGGQKQRQKRAATAAETGAAMAAEMAAATGSDCGSNEGSNGQRQRKKWQQRGAEMVAAKGSDGGNNGGSNQQQPAATAAAIRGAATEAATGSDGGNTLRDDGDGQRQWLMAMGDGLWRWQQWQIFFLFCQQLLTCSRFKIITKNAKAGNEDKMKR